MAASASMGGGLGAWLVERFPPVVYTVLVALFVGAGFGMVHALVPLGPGIPPRLVAGAVVVWLFFLHLRIFDEHKDFATDRVAYPDRVLSRGDVTLATLRTLAVGAIALQAALAALLGTTALLAWAAAFAFSVAMRVEFGLGDWLRDRIVLYAITHNPVVALLALFVYAATGARWIDGYGWFVAAASLGSLAFEVGRKTRLPAEEHPGVASYTTELGQAGGRALLAACLVGHVAMVSGALYTARVADPWPVVLAWSTAVPALGWLRGPAKRVELGASLAMLLGFLLIAVAGWSAP